MSLTFPIEPLDDVLCFTREFRLSRVQEYSRDAAARIFTKDLGSPLWMAVYDTGRMTWDECVDLEAWLGGLNGSEKTFLARDTRREYPRMAPDGSFTDQGQIASTTDNETIAFKGLPANFELRRGDYFHYQHTSATRWQLHRLLEGVTAGGAGNTAEVAVEPALTADAVVDKNVKFKLPSCEMQIMPGSVQFNDQGGNLGSVTFSGIQRT